jgi:4'-phosphopantetheinyl transferase
LVDTVLLRLDTVSACAAQAESAGAGWLSVAERQRLNAISAPRRRQEFLAGRWLVRQVLVQSQGGEPGQWALSAPLHGPPAVERGCGAQPLHISISHSADRVACAVAPVPVGIDIEQPHRPRPLGALVQGVCTPHEQSRWQELPEAAQAPHFYAMWTVKEAWLKRRGEALSPGRLAQLETRPARSGDAVCARVWQSASLTLAVFAPAEAVLQWAGADALLQGLEPMAWAVDDLTSP